MLFVRVELLRKGPAPEDPEVVLLSFPLAVAAEPTYHTWGGLFDPILAEPKKGAKRLQRLDVHVTPVWLDPEQQVS